MDKRQAQELVSNTLQNDFDKDRFIYFVKNLLNHIDESKFFHARGYVKEKFKKTAPIVKTYERIGTYTDPEGKKVDVLIVYLEKNNSLDRARTTLRNFVADYLKQRDQKDVGLVAFVSPDTEDWRFSFVKMDYKIDSTNGKVEEEFTPARRYSFLVGKHENSHTAQSCLLPLLLNDEINPTLKELEDVFSVEKVTKEFFEKYHGLFLNLKKSLDEVIKIDEKVKADFKTNNINTVDFAKKLLGQIVFLYFLQKKGWFGVKRDEDWGTGPKNFLRELFDEKHGKYTNFFNDIMEPLFYQALRNDRRHDDDYYDKLKCKIPFLNGGLFDPINNYDWVHTDILLPNELFSNSEKTKEGDTGNGILDIFDRYNFTVKEDEPLEKEVAVDPEMLGKVFENLLEVKDRKSKGTYYTPREIVHYMCQQSLINYLHSELNPEAIIYEKIGEKQFDMLGNKVKKGQLDLTVKHRSNPEIPKEDIEILIQHGESVAENEAAVGTTKSYSYKLKESIRQNAKLIDDKLASIKICDPAIGSGAFPVGMMSEIIKARNVLSAYIKKDKNRSIYNFKRECIEKSLYGVDIDLGAVEIAKLRLWLSLVVDEDDIKQIKPLPNLDYKIVCGNSLLGVNRNELWHWKLLEKIEELKTLLFDEINPNKKQEYKEQIDEIIGKITNGHKDFDFEIYFSEVFHEKKGFDVVIGNPPYFQLQKNNKVSQELSSQGYHTYSKSSDIYCVFYERGVGLLKNRGILSYISSNSWMKTKYGALLRKYLKENTNPLTLIDFENSQVFDTAIVESNVIVLEKSAFQNKLKALSFNLTSNKYDGITNYFNNNYVALNRLDDNGWIISSSNTSLLRAKIEKDSTPLKQLNQRIYIGILNGYNDAFVISTETKNKLIKEDPRSAEIIKPMLRGRDVGKYYYVWQELWLINGHNGIKNRLPRIDVKKDHPAIYKHLAKYRDKLEIRHNKGSHWTNLRNCVYFEEFEKPKIIWGELSNKPKFAYDDKGFIAEATLFVMVGDNLKYLLGILNSKLGLWYFEQISTSSGMGTSRWKKYKIELFPIKNPNKVNIEGVINMVNKILAVTKSSDYMENSAKKEEVKEYERQIDEMVYKLYGLTPKEKEIVENSSKK